MDSQKIAFQGELMLLGWAESSTRGRTVTFLLDEETEAHPFKDFTIRAGKRAGQRFMAVLVQVDEGERPVEQRRTLSQQAAAYCKNPDFWGWATARSFERPVTDEASARAFILELLNIDSRSVIDKDETVALKFREWVVVPFEAHIKFFTPSI